MFIATFFVPCYDDVDESIQLLTQTLVNGCYENQNLGESILKSVRHFQINIKITTPFKKINADCSSQWLHFFAAINHL